MASKQVVISTEGDKQVHAWADEEQLTIKSVILSEGLGNYIPLCDLPDYIADEIKSGIPGLEIVSIDEAAVLAEAAQGPVSEIKDTIISGSLDAPSGSPARPTIGVTAPLPAASEGDELSLTPPEREKREKEESPIHVPADAVIQSA